jgi:hypothetical protein
VPVQAGFGRRFLRGGRLARALHEGGRDDRMAVALSEESMNIMNQKALVLVAGLGACAAMGCTAAGSGESVVDGTVAEEAAELGTDICPAGVPATLKPAADQTIKAKYNAVGVQVYVCGVTAANPTTPSWVFVNPQANLMSDCGALLGTHFIGPTWQGQDGSTVVGSKVAGASVDPTALPWLLLTATSHADVDGFFKDVTSIQRLATVGGNAPTTGCDPTTLGTILQVPYSAEYVFYKTKSKGKIVQCGGS